MTEQEGFRPTGRHARSGRCTLCGNRATLTKAHVPPRAAFNEGSVSWGGTTGDNRLVYGRPKSGGAKLYAHCQACRARTSPWDDEYLRWAYTFADNLFRSPGKGQRTHIEGKIAGVRPGRFIRSALAGMTALTPSLIDSHPDLVRVVREGIPSSLSEDIRFLVAIAPDGSRVHIEGSHEALVVRISLEGESKGTTTTVPAVSAVVHHPPFSLLLADRQLLSSLPHADCTHWLQFGVDDVTDVPLVLPVVDLPRIPDAPVPISMLRFLEARA